LRPIRLLLLALLLVAPAACAPDDDAEASPGLRVVSLSPTHTEMLYSIGAGELLVGVDLASNFPAEVESLPKVDAFNFNVEEVAALEPDLVVLAFDFQDETGQLAAIGIETLLLPPAVNLDDAYQQIRTLGDRLDAGLVAGDLADSMRADIDATIARAFVDEPMAIYHEVDDSYYSANSSTFLGDIYRRMGLLNIADDVRDEFGSGYPQLSAEKIVDSNPRIIFLADTGFGVTIDSVAGRPGWDSIEAVAAGRIIALDPDIAGRWGPRTPQLVSQIAQAVGGAVTAGSG
jgi:iron complex transport system substrate-binding protein